MSREWQHESDVFIEQLQEISGLCRKHTIHQVLRALVLNETNYLVESLKEILRGIIFPFFVER